MKSMRPKSVAAHAAFHRPWTVEEEEWWFCVRDHDGQQLAYVYFDDPRFSDQTAHQRRSAVRKHSMAASTRPWSSSKSLRLYQASANVGSTRVAARNAASASTLWPLARSMFPRLNGADASVGSLFIRMR